MYAITGITGKVGGAVARTLREARCPVRAVVRDESRGKSWAAAGCEIALAGMQDPAALTRAFAGAEGVFVLIPPLFDPAPDFREAHEFALAIRTALAAARPDRVVCLSTIGAQATQPNLLQQLGLIEKSLGDLPLPITFLRPAWFMENHAWDIPSAREQGAIPSFLQPLDRAIPMVATADVGRVGAELLQQPGRGRQVVELEGPHPVSPHQIAATLARLLGRPVRAEAVPRPTWPAVFQSQGMKNSLPRIQMLEGFNEGWLRFEGPESAILKGKVDLESALRPMVY